jgi:hypothetical protein
METSGQLCAPAALAPETESRYPLPKRLVAPELVWTFSRTERSLAPARSRILIPQWHRPQLYREGYRGFVIANPLYKRI